MDKKYATAVKLSKMKNIYAFNNKKIEFSFQ